jgi:carbon monoxide dehydrogenase subunit G
MNIEVQVDINGTKEEVWKVITDIENSTETIRGIEKIEVLEKPADSFVGLKWRETRTMFGKTATEVMWITDAEENKSYKTRAESHGAVYVTKFDLSEEGKNVRLTMNFEGTPQTFGAKIMSALMGGMMKKSTEEALMQDLMDIKAKVEDK